MEAIQKFDLSLFRAINGSSGFELLDHLMLFFSNRNVWLVVSVVLLAIAFVKKNSRLKRFFLFMTIAVGVTDMFCYEVLKPGFKRLRPCHGLEQVNLVQPGCGSEYGFPSNHGANSMATLVTVVLLVGTSASSGMLFGALAVLVLVVGFSRIYLGVHYPMDVAFGYLVGGVIALVSFKIVSNLESRFKVRRSM